MCIVSFNRYTDALLDLVVTEPVCGLVVRAKKSLKWSSRQGVASVLVLVRSEFHIFFYRLQFPLSRRDQKQEHTPQNTTNYEPRTVEADGRKSRKWILSLFELCFDDIIGDVGKILVKSHSKLRLATIPHCFAFINGHIVLGLLDDSQYFPKKNVARGMILLASYYQPSFTQF